MESISITIAADCNASDVIDAQLDLRQPPSVWATHVGASVMGAFLLVGVVGSLWILAAIATGRRPWNVIDYFILSLTVQDLLTYVLVMFFIVLSYVERRWIGGDVMCKLNPELTVFFTGSALWHSALIAFHRFVVVCHNGIYSRWSKSVYIAFALITARVVPALLVFPGYGLTASHYKSQMLRCILRPTQGSRIVFISVVLMGLPVVIVLACYLLIFSFVWRMTRHVSNPDMRLRREMQITKMFGVVFAVILLGFVPYAVLRNFDGDNSAPADVYVLVTVVYGVATCSNPFVYGAMSTDIRRACITFAQKCFPACKCFATATLTEPNAPAADTNGDTANSSKPLLRSRPTKMVRTCCGLRRAASSECVELGASGETASTRASRQKTSSSAAPGANSHVGASDV